MKKNLDAVLMCTKINRMQNRFSLKDFIVESYQAIKDFLIDDWNKRLIFIENQEFPLWKLN